MYILMTSMSTCWYAPWQHAHMKIDGPEDMLIIEYHMTARTRLRAAMIAGGFRKWLICGDRDGTETPQFRGVHN